MILLLSLLCTPLLVASEWVTACDIVGRATFENSEDKFEVRSFSFDICFL